MLLSHGATDSIGKALTHLAKLLATEVPYLNGNLFETILLILKL